MQSVAAKFQLGDCYLNYRYARMHISTHDASAIKLTVLTTKFY